MKITEIIREAEMPIGQIGGLPRPDFAPGRDMAMNRAEALLLKQAFDAVKKPGDDTVQHFVRWQETLRREDQPRFKEKLITQRAGGGSGGADSWEAPYQIELGSELDPKKTVQNIKNTRLNKGY
jgi:hypothetical protein